MLFTCRGRYPPTCQYFRCRQQFIPDIRQRCLNQPNINLQLRSALDASQVVQFDLKFIDLMFASKLDREKCSVHDRRSYSLVPARFEVTNPINSGTSSETLTHLQLVQQCVAQDTTRQPIIIDTDTDIDDLWAIHYLINVITLFELCQYDFRH